MVWNVFLWKPNLSLDGIWWHFCLTKTFYFCFCHFHKWRTFQCPHFILIPNVVWSVALPIYGPIGQTGGKRHSGRKLQSQHEKKPSRQQGSQLPPQSINVITATIKQFSFGSGVMNYNREMIIMMIIIISEIITGQSQGAVTGDISRDVWLICCEAGSLAIEQESPGTMQTVCIWVCCVHIFIQILCL